MSVSPSYGSVRHASAVLLLMAVILSGCPRERVEHPADRPEDTTALQMPDPTLEGPALTDRDLLLLVERLPPGSTYDDVVELFPQATVPRPFTHGDLDQARSEVEVVVLDQVTTLEFNFEDDGLYSYFYHAHPLDCDEAQRLYERLTSFYNAAYGAGREEAQEEPGLESRTTLWRQPRFEVAVTHGQQGDECRVGWGFQEPRAVLPGG